MGAPRAQRFRMVVVSAMLATALAVPSASQAATIPVTTTADSVAADGACSLREAITAANTDSGANGCPAGLGSDLVKLPAGTFALAIAGGGEDANATGDLDLTSGLTVEGAGASATTIDGAGIDRVFDIRPGSSAAIQSLTVTAGRAPSGTDGADHIEGPSAPGVSGDPANGGPGAPGGDGGGIRNAGSLALTATELVGNSAGDGGRGGDGVGGAGGAAPASSGTAGEMGGSGEGGDGGRGGHGGAIYSTGPLTIADSAVRDNRAGAGGAGGDGVGGDGGAGAAGSPDGGRGGHGAGGFSGSAGVGGNGGGIAADAGSLTITNTAIVANAGGTGARGGDAIGGDAADGGSGAGGVGGNGGSGGVGVADNGSGGGSGGGLWRVVLNAGLTNVTLHGNVSGSGGGGGTGIGGDGGRGGNGTLGGNGGNGGAGNINGPGDGGGGGSAGGAGLATTMITHGTVTGNSPGAGGAPGGGQPGQGGAGGSVGATGTPGAPGSTPAPGFGSTGASGSVGGLSGSFDLFRSIVASNIGANCAGIYNADSVTIAFPSGCSAKLAEPKLAPLADNGGLGPTQRPTPGSPAIDSASGCTGTDQRGVPRPADATCDVGAYEVAPPRAATGGASGVAATSASVAASVTPNQRVATVRFEYGTTSAYGSSTPAREAGAGATASDIAESLAGLAPSTTYHYRVVATTADGTGTGEDRTFTTAAPSVVAGPGGGGGPGGGLLPDVVKPLVRTASLTNTTFAVGRGATPITAGRRAAKKGTTIRWSLSEAATMTIAVQQAAPGRRQGRRCVKPTRRLRRAKKCTRLISLGTLRRGAKEGAGSLAFSGRIGRKALKPGSYRFRLVATDAAGNKSAERLLKFRIVR